MRSDLRTIFVICSVLLKTTGRCVNGTGGLSPQSFSCRFGATEVAEDRRAQDDDLDRHARVAVPKPLQMSIVEPLPLCFGKVFAAIWSGPEVGTVKVYSWPNDVGPASAPP